MIAISMSYWSEADVYQILNGRKGSIHVGLWVACGDLKDETLFSSFNNDCRKGHCVAGSHLCRGCSLSGNNLCSRSKVSATFLMISLLCTSYVLTILVPSSCRKDIPQYDNITIAFMISGLSGLITWASWAHWNNSMGDGSGLDGIINVTNFRLSSGFILCLLGNVFTLMCWYTSRSLQRYYAVKRKAKLTAVTPGNQENNDVECIEMKGTALSSSTDEEFITPRFSGSGREGGDSGAPRNRVYLVGSSSGSGTLSESSS